jgi:hypothetical protein
LIPAFASRHDVSPLRAASRTSTSQTSTRTRSRRHAPSRVRTFLLAAIFVLAHTTGTPAPLVLGLASHC